MPGRRPIPIELKRQQGDTRQRGSRKFAESLDSKVEGPRGGVRPPVGLEGPAKKHFQEIVDSLDAMNLLSTADVGTITAAAVAFAGLMENQTDAGKFDKFSQRYLLASDRLGLSPTARARLPKRDEKHDPLEAAIA